MAGSGGLLRAMGRLRLAGGGVGSRFRGITGGLEVGSAGQWEARRWMADEKKRRENGVTVDGRVIYSGRVMKPELLRLNAPKGVQSARKRLPYKPPMGPRMAARRMRIRTDQIEKKFFPEREYVEHEGMDGIGSYEQPPRMYKRKTAPFQYYGIGQNEVLKFRYAYKINYYKQLCRYMDMALRKTGNEAANLMVELESLVYTFMLRAGWVQNHRMARHLTYHKGVYVNGVPVESIYMRLHVGDVLQIHPLAWSVAGRMSYHTARKRKVHFDNKKAWVDSPAGMCPWMEINRTIMAIVYVRKPTDEEMYEMRYANLGNRVKVMNLRPDRAISFYLRMGTRHMPMRYDKRWSIMHAHARNTSQGFF